MPITRRRPSARFPWSCSILWVRTGVDPGEEPSIAPRRFHSLSGDSCRLLGGRETVSTAGALVFMDRALVLGRWQRYRYRQRHRSRREARFTDNQLLIEFLDALFGAEQRPGIAGAVLVKQEAARPSREIGGRLAVTRQAQPCARRPLGIARKSCDLNGGPDSLIAKRQSREAQPSRRPSSMPSRMWRW